MATNLKAELAKFAYPTYIRHIGVSKFIAGSQFTISISLSENPLNERLSNNPRIRVKSIAFWTIRPTAKINSIRPIVLECTGPIFTKYSELVDVGLLARIITLPFVLRSLKGRYCDLLMGMIRRLAVHHKHLHSLHLHLTTDWTVPQADVDVAVLPSW